MGEYYEWVNVDKKELIGPYHFDLGNKLYESAHDGNPLLNALYELISTDWAGDALVFLGDEINIPDNVNNEALKRLHEQRTAWGEAGYDADYVFEEYHNISAIFKDSEGITRQEIQFLLERNDLGVNEYRINPRDPFNGFFKRSGKTARYVINETKGEYFDSQKTTWPGASDDCDEKLGFNPLPLLFAYGRSAKAGAWIGDEIRVSDEEPGVNYTDISTRRFD